MSRWHFSMKIPKLFWWLFFNFKYLGRPRWDTGQSPPELLDFISNHPAGRALDVGCGSGTNCLTMARSGWRTTGIDLAGRAIRKARLRFQAAGLNGEFLTGDIAGLNLPEYEFDLVLDIGCYHSLPADSRVIYRKSIAGWLKPGGWYMVYGHVPASLAQTDFGLSEQDVAEFQTVLRLEKREDGMDHGERKAVWLWFTKHTK